MADADISVPWVSGGSTALAYGSQLAPRQVSSGCRDAARESHLRERRRRRERHARVSSCRSDIDVAEKVARTGGTWKGGKAAKFAANEARRAAAMGRFSGRIFHAYATIAPQFHNASRHTLLSRDAPQNGPIARPLRFALAKTCAIFAQNETIRRDARCDAQ